LNLLVVVVVEQQALLEVTVGQGVVVRLAPVVLETPQLLLHLREITAGQGHRLPLDLVVEVVAVLVPLALMEQVP
jgi:hypothetical protein